MAKARIRQRVLGAAVISSLGFIAYSILIQSSSSAYIDRSAQIPVQTKYIEPLDFDEPQGLGSLADLENINPEQMFIADEPVEIADIESAPALDDQGIPNSWAIKVGSFATEERALEIREQLINAGHKAYVRRISNLQSGDILYRVTVGPYIDATEVVVSQSEIDALLDVETAVMDYEP